MKIDLGELYKNKATLDSSVKNLKSTIQSARDYLQALADSEALQGKVKTAIDAKLKNHQIPLMTNYLTALSYLRIIRPCFKHSKIRPVKQAIELLLIQMPCEI
ncbi:hypothetical protein [Streptococcus intermedius]|uniref:hypothetical protein n=1 Tax=Streptococcus intermedius TaxID=1338 RepID=UPI00124D5618|nr:hypothetical protein [Streptococcus intermedius]